MDLRLGILLPQILRRIARRLAGTAEGAVQADAQDRFPLLCRRTKYLQIVLHGGHGGLGEHPGHIRHALIKLPGGNIPLLPIVGLISQGDIVGHHLDSQLLASLPPQIAGAVAYNTEVHTPLLCSVAPPSLPESGRDRAPPGGN